MAGAAAATPKFGEKSGNWCKIAPETLSEGLKSKIFMPRDLPSGSVYTLHFAPPAQSGPAPLPTAPIKYCFLRTCLHQLSASYAHTQLACKFWVNGEDAS